MCGNVGEHGFLTATLNSLQASYIVDDGNKGPWLCLWQDISLGETIQACWNGRASNATEAASHAAPQPCPPLQRSQQECSAAPALQALPLSMLLSHSAQARLEASSWRSQARCLKCPPLHAVPLIQLLSVYPGQISCLHVWHVCNVDVWSITTCMAMDHAE